jgi:tetratricopeptide (TPR) repeat protein
MSSSQNPSANGQPPVNGGKPLISAGQSPAETHFQAAVALHRQGRLEEAANRYGLALAEDPTDPRFWGNLGVVLRSQEKVAAAEACYRRALALDPGNAGAWSNLGNALRYMGRLEEALACQEKSVEINPEFAEGVYNMGLVLHDLGRLAESVAAFDRVIAMRPEREDVRWDRALSTLLSGDLKSGFEQYEWRWSRPELKKRYFRQPRWDGQSAPGQTILIHSEQGFGDCIQFVRYLPMAAARSRGSIVLECQPELVSLLTGLPGVSQVVAKGERLPDFHLHLPMLSLPMVCGTDLDSVPAQIPYLSAPAWAGFPVAKPAGTKLSVGISWAGKPTHKNDRNRSAQLADFLPLAAFPGVTLYSLQKGERAKDRVEQASGVLIRDLGTGCREFADTAKIMQQLDLIITVDTAVGHLAGALGRPVWVLIPFSPDWRWLLGREDTPWYPTMRLFRQQRPGEWGETFGRVRDALAGLAAGLEK